MGSSRNRGPPSPRRDEDPSWDSEDPPKPRRKPPRTYSVLFIIKTFINHHLPVTSLNLNWSQVLKCIFSGRRYDALRMVSILRMEVLTIRDVFILNFAPVSLSVSPPGPREFVMHFNSRRQIIAVLVRLRHKIWVACKAKSAPLPKNWLEASTARGTLFTSSPRSQHSGIVRKQQVFSSSESALAIGGMLQMSVHSWSILSEREAYDMLSFIPICCTIMYVFSGNKCSAGTHT